MNIAKALKEWRDSRGLTCQMQQAGYANNVQEELLEAESSTTNLELVDAICDIAILTLNCIEDYKIEDLIYTVKDTTPYGFHEDITFILERDFHITEISHLLSHLNHYTEGMGYNFIKCLEEEFERNGIPHLCIYGKFEKNLQNVDVNEVAEVGEKGFVFIVDAINEILAEGLVNVSSQVNITFTIEN